MLKKSLAIGIIFFLVISSVPYSTLSNEISTSTFGGNTLYVGGTGPGNYTRIQDGIDNASDGDTVFVYNGTYPISSTININKSINLIGENRDTTTILPGEPEENQLMLTQAEYISVSQFTFRNIIIRNSKGNHVTINNNTFRIDVYNQAWGSGVINSDGSNNTFKENTIVLINQTEYNRPYCGVGLIDYHSFILNNTISGAKEGVYIWGKTTEHKKKGQNTISGNTFSHNEVGLDIYLRLAHPLLTNTITQNNFINNDVHATFTIKVESIKNLFFELLSSDGLPSQHWDGNYWDNHQDDGRKIISGGLQLGDTNLQIPWREFDSSPRDNPVK